MFEKLGQMKVSIDRGLYKQIDVQRVSLGSHYTEEDCWLVAPIREFIRELLTDGYRHVLDPFAGDGHLLKAVLELHQGLSASGLDISGEKWKTNDSLTHIPTIKEGFICTNPPYLAKYSARRKGVYTLVSKYFEDTGYSDLYQLAILRSLESGMPAVMILPETFITSGLFRTHLERVVILEKNNPFASTETPVCVACFDPRTPVAATRCYKDDKYLGTLSELSAAGAVKYSRHARAIKFNVVHGPLALKAVDGTSSEDRIRFLRGDRFDYDTSMIKVSSRLMTRIEIVDFDLTLLDQLILIANKEIEMIRKASADVILSPFKGNNRAGQRRRRLDYGLARAVLGRALDRIFEGDEGIEQRTTLL